MRRPRLVAGAVAVVVLAAGVVVAVRVLGSSTCGAEKVAATSPLQSTAKMAARPNEQRDALTKAVSAMAAPFGPVDAGLDFYYDQYLHLYGVQGGMLAFTKNNAPVTYLSDASLKPRWALKPTSKRTAFDSSEDRFLLLDLEASEPGTISSYDLASGDQEWCVSLSSKHADGQPVSTAFVPGGDVVTALPDGSGIRLTRLSGKDGAERWTRKLTSADRADYLGMLTDRLLLVGGTEEYRLAQTTPRQTAPPKVLTAVDVKTGKVAWTWDPGQGEAVHVIGVDDGTVLAMVRGAGGPTRVALSSSGRELWTISTNDGAFESTLRGDVVLVKSPKALDAYDTGTGELRWFHPLPKNRTYFPYGFTLSQMPSTDADHLLLPTTTSLDLLDLRDGKTVSYALPTDGVSSTYWPYQLLVTPKHLGVLANTGAVLATRE